MAVSISAPMKKNHAAARERAAQIWEHADEAPAQTMKCAPEYLAPKSSRGRQVPGIKADSYGAAGVL
jgi:hypothetical protein